MDVVFRADASRAIGLGHVKRCLSLAQAWMARGAHCRLVTRDLGVDVASLAAREGVETLWLPPPNPADAARTDAGVPLAHAAWLGVSQADDAEQTRAAVQDTSPDWLVVDHYGLDARWHVPVRAALGCALAAIDDLADRNLAVDVLIDHNHAADHRTKYAAHVPAAAMLLGGPGFALLGPAYANAPRHGVGAQVDSIGIFMGGLDSAGAGLVALHACERAGFAGPVEIVTASSNPHLAALRTAAQQRDGCRVTCDLPDLSGFFARHGIQIGAGGGATWERCCIGAPTVAVVVADNQRQVLGPLAGMDVLLLADANPPTVEAVAIEIRRLMDSEPLRRRLSQRARNLVDGQGAARVVTQLMDNT